jgi:hypothetical protein
MMVGAATYLAFFAFQKQSAFNYYWFVSALLAIATTTAAATESGRRVTDTEGAGGVSPQESRTGVLESR